MNVYLQRRWVRYGLIAGVFALVGTLGSQFAIALLNPSDLCRIGPIIIFLFSLAGFVIFIWCAAAAGFATGRSRGTTSEAALSGVVVGAVSGVGNVIGLLLQGLVASRLEQLITLCPNTTIVFGGGSPPPGVVIPTPPAGFTSPFATGPGGFDPLAIILALIGTAISIGVGCAIAAGIAALGGLVGGSMRAQHP